MKPISRNVFALCTLWAAGASAQPSLSVTTTPATCFGVANGTAQLFPSGAGPFTYNWQNGATTQNRTGLASGTHTVTVTDVNGQFTTTDVVILDNLVIEGTVDITQALSCSDGDGGAATVTALSGTAPFTYNWTTGHDTQTATGLSAGTFGAYITDVNGCRNADPILVELRVLEVEVTVAANETCAGAADGSVTATATGGTADYTFSWSDTGVGSGARTGLVAGEYIATVTDDNGCTAMASVTVTSGGACAVDAGVDDAGLTDSGTSTDADVDPTDAGDDAAMGDDSGTDPVDMGRSPDAGTPRGGGGCTVSAEGDSTSGFVALLALVGIAIRVRRRMS